MAGEGVIGRVVYEVGEVGLSQLKAKLTELANTPLTLKVDAGSSSSVSQNVSQLQAMKNMTAGLRNEWTATGKSITAELDAMRAKALAVSTALSPISNEYVKATGIAASATRGMAAEAKQAASVQAQAIASVVNSIQGEINAYKAGTREVGAHVSALEASRNAALDMADLLRRNSSEFVQITRAAAQADAAIASALSPRQASKINPLGDKIRTIENEIASLKSLARATGIDMSQSLDASRAEALDLASALPKASDGYRKLTTAAASAQRGIDTQTRTVSDEILRASNRVNALRNVWVATGRNVIPELKEMKLQLAGLVAQEDLATTAGRRAATAYAQAERAVTTIEGGMSRGGLAEQVKRGTLNIGPRLFGVRGAATEAASLIPGRAGAYAYYARPLISSLGTLTESLGTATVATGVLGAAVVAATAYGVALDAQLQQEQTYLEAITGQAPGAYSGLTATVQALSTQLPDTTKAIYATAEAAAQLGVDGAGNIAAFTQTVEQLAYITRGDAGQIAEDLAKFLNETGITSSMPGYISALNQSATALAAVHINTAATASSTLTLARYFASVASQVGLTRPQILALSGALSSVGSQAQSGGMQLSRFFLDMATDADQNNAKLAAMAQIAGQTTDAFRKLVQTNPVQAFVDLAKGLHQAQGNGAEFSQMMAGIGAKNQRLIRALAEVAQGSDSFSKAIGDVNTALDKQDYLSGIVKQGMNNLSSQLGLTGHDIQVLFEVWGNPTATAALGWVKDLNSGLLDIIAASKALGTMFYDSVYTPMHTALEPIAHLFGEILDAIEAMLHGMGALGAHVPGIAQFETLYSQYKNELLHPVAAGTASGSSTASSNGSNASSGNGVQSVSAPGKLTAVDKLQAQVAAFPLAVTSALQSVTGIWMSDRSLSSIIRPNAGYTSAADLQAQVNAWKPIVDAITQEASALRTATRTAMMTPGVFGASDYTEQVRALNTQLADEQKLMMTLRLDGLAPTSSVYKQLASDASATAAQIDQLNTKIAAQKALAIHQNALAKIQSTLDSSNMSAIENVRLADILGTPGNEMSVFGKPSSAKEAESQVAMAAAAAQVSAIKQAIAQTYSETWNFTHDAVAAGSSVLGLQGQLKSAQTKANAYEFTSGVKSISAGLGAPLFKQLLEQSRIGIATGTPFNRVAYEETQISGAITQIDKLGAQSGATTDQIATATKPLYERLSTLSGVTKKAADETAKQLAAQKIADAARAAQAQKLKDESSVASAALSSFAGAVKNSGNAFEEVAGQFASDIKFNSSGGFDLHASMMSAVTGAASFVANIFGNLVSTNAAALEAQSKAYANIGPGKDVLGIGQTLSNYQNASKNKEALDAQFQHLAQEKRTIDTRTLGGAAAGATVGAIIGSFFGGPIGAWIGASLGATAGGMASNEKAKRDLAKQMSDTQKQINNLNTELTNYVAKWQKALGLTADDFASAIQHAFSATSFNDLKNSLGNVTKGFTSQLKDGIDGVIRNALVNQFIAKILQPQIAKLASGVFDEIKAGANPDMATVQKQIKGIEASAKPFYETLNRLGLAGGKAAEKLGQVAASAKNLPSILKLHGVEYQSATPTGAPIIVNVQGNIYGVNDMKRVVAQAVDEHQKRTGLRMMGNPAYAGGVR